MTTTAKNRQTKTIIEVGHQEEFGIDNGGFQWITFCVDHEEFIGHETRKVAQQFASSPMDWCETCAKV